MQALQPWKMAVPTLASRSPQSLRLQIRIATSRIQQTRLSSASPRTLFTSSDYQQPKTLFSSIQLTRPTAFPLFTSSSNCNNNFLTTIDQIRSFSSSASLAGKRATYNPSRRVQKRRHGFLARLRSRTGRKILMRRRLKGRKDLSW